MAVRVLAVALADAEASAAVRLVRALVVLHIARAAERGRKVDEVVVVRDDEVAAARGDRRRGNATDCNEQSQGMLRRRARRTYERQ